MIIPFSVIGALLMTRLWNETPLRKARTEPGVSGRRVCRATRRVSRCMTVELHRHFEAGLTPETIARLAARHGVDRGAHARGPRRRRRRPAGPGLDPRATTRAVAAGFGAPDGFARFIDSFGLPLSVLRTLDDLEEAVFDQLVECAEARQPPHRAARLAVHLPGAGRRAGRGDRRGAGRAASTARGASARVSGTFILAFSRQKGLGPAATRRPCSARRPVVAQAGRALHRADRPVGLDIAGFPGDAVSAARCSRTRWRPRGKPACR